MTSKATIALHNSDKSNGEIARALKISTNKAWHVVKHYQEIGDASDKSRKAVIKVEGNHFE